MRKRDSFCVNALANERDDEEELCAKEEAGGELEFAEAGSMSTFIPSLRWTEEGLLTRRPTKGPRAWRLMKAR